MIAKVLRLAVWRTAQVSRPELAIRSALSRVERTVPARPVVKVAVVRQRPVLTLVEVPSAWDPEPVVVIPPVRDEELILQEINGCKTLLLETIRRAAYDWVLYRTSRRMAQRVLAETAYRWLFTEKPGTPDWQERQREGKHITSFESICESLDLDSDTVRKHIQRLTAKNVMSVGRPAEYRRRDVFSTHSGDDDVYSVPGVLVEFDDSVSNDEPSY